MTLKWFIDMAGYCTRCGGSGFRKPSQEYKGNSAYVRMILAKTPAEIGKELERLQSVIAKEREAPTYRRESE